jgi:hypothetical protein
VPWKSRTILPEQGFLASIKKKEEEIHSLNFLGMGFSFFFK